ncbi:MAG: thiamine pyrophosphate-binding protein [Deltaproteobacteria bacterium]|nr:thiamine pyrophosphate-binding protein [Deltaproteobacteria bacterium]
MAYEKYGSDVIVDMMRAYKIPYVSLNPGATFRGLHDSLVNYGKNQMPMITCCHEEIAVQIAHGYAKACGKPMVAIVHNVVGLLHCNQAIYYAYLDRVPVMIMGATGPMDTTRRRPQVDWAHTANIQGNAIRDYVKWDDQPYNVASVPESFARAYRVMMTEPKGPVYLCWDAAIQEGKLDREIPIPNVDRLMPPSPIQGDLRALEKAAEMLVAAETPVILTGSTGRNPESFDSLARLAELLAVPVVDFNKRLNFPTDHPLNLTGSDIIEKADLILSLDVSDLYGPLVKLDGVTRKTTYKIRKGCKIIDIGFADLNISKWSQDYMQLQEIDLHIAADTLVAIPQLKLFCEEILKRNSKKREEIQGRFAGHKRTHEALGAAWKEEVRKNWDGEPMSLPRLAHEIWQVIKDEDWVLTANTLEKWALRLWDFDRPYRHPGGSRGTATQIGISTGVALAHRGTGRLVVDIQPDGDLMYDLGALWIGAHDKIPMLIVMYNNRAYYNDWEHQIRIARQRGTDEKLAYVGMEVNNPPPDFAGVARSLGCHGEGPIFNGNQVGPALKRAIEFVKKEGKLALVDTVTQFT